MKILLFICFLIILLLAGVAYWAKPGEVLYPFKVSVNEESWAQLIQWFPHPSGNWEATRLEKRLVDAERYFVTMPVEAGVVLDLQKRIDSNLNRINGSTDQLLREKKTSHATTLATRTEGILEAHSQVLEWVNNKSPEKTEGMSRFKQSIAKAYTAFVGNRKNLESSLSVESNEPQLLAELDSEIVDVRNYLIEVKNYIYEHKGSLSGEFMQEVEERYESADADLVEAKDKEGANLFGEAKVLLNKSYREGYIAYTLVQASVLWGFNEK